MPINIGQGTIIKMGGSSIAQVVEIDGPDYTVPSVDKTNLADVFRRMRAGLPEPGKATFTIQYDPQAATHNTITNAIQTFPQTVTAFIILWNTVNGADSWNCNGFITKFHPKGMNQDDNLEADVEIQFDSVNGVAIS